MGFLDFAQPGRSFARCFANLVATLTLFAIASWVSACREAMEPERARSVENQSAASGISAESDSLGFTGSADSAGVRVRWEPARPSAAESRLIDTPAPQQTADPLSLDSDVYVALDPDSETRASEIINDSSRRETGFSTDSTGRAAVDSDAYALYRD